MKKTVPKKRFLNVGCGKKFHPDWINIDLYSESKYVIEYDIRKDLPFPNDTFQVVYHSHVLEHIQKGDADRFIRECHRVMSKGGIIRVVVPDLEVICRNYLTFLEQNVTQPSVTSQKNYEWTMIELLDQSVRTFRGGEKGKLIKQGHFTPTPFISSRNGLDALQAKEEHLKFTSEKRFRFIYRLKRFWNKSLSTQWNSINRLFFSTILMGQTRKNYKLGCFRNGGDIHQWMYDRYSLTKLLGDCGFTGVEIKTAFESNITNWLSYELDAKGGIIYKPDSLYVEAYKM